MPRTREKACEPSRGTSKAALTRPAGHIQPDALFRAVLDSAPDAIAVIDGGGRIVLANAQTESLFGYSMHELLGGPVDLLLPERLRTAHFAQRAAYRASPRKRPMGAGLDLVARRKNGTEFPVEISLSPVATDDGMLITAIVRGPPGREAITETVEFLEVEVLDASGVGLLCRIRERDLLIPRLLVQPGSGVRSAGDRGTLIIERWLAIGLGLVSPFLPGPRHGLAVGPRRHSTSAA